MKIFVYINLAGVDYKVGTLWLHQNQRNESSSFKYDEEWIRNPLSFAIDPNLKLNLKVHHTNLNQEIFGCFRDCIPDHWGQKVMRYNHIFITKQDYHKHTTLLISVVDDVRLGALRFATEENGKYINTSSKNSIPPLRKLNELLRAVNNIENDTECENDYKVLLAPGTAMGGARAKALVFDNNKLLLAKFPQASDKWSVIQWEALALTLAKHSGIEVPIYKLVNIAKQQVLLLERFDRIRNKRLPFISAMTMLNANHSEDHSYLEILAEIRRNSSRPKQDVRELFRRIVFNILITNTDDHLRNHGFLFDDTGWKLSPAYDLNPVPLHVNHRFHCLAINEFDSYSSVETALQTAKEYDISFEEAKSIIKEVGNTVSKWKEEAKKLGINNKEIELMAPAFEHENLKLACSFN